MFVCNESKNLVTSYFFIVDCPVLDKLSDSIHISSGRLEFGTSVTFTCDTGYLLEGARTLICDINGTWSYPPPVCKSQ